MWLVQIKKLTSGRSVPYVGIKINENTANTLVDTSAAMSRIDDDFRSSHSTLSC